MVALVPGLELPEDCEQPGLAAAEGRYRVERTARGFVLDGGANRRRVRVDLREASWWVSAAEPDAESVTGTFGLFEVRRMIDAVAQMIFSSWQPRDSRTHATRLRRWATQKGRRAIARVVGEERRRLLETPLDPLILQTQRAVFAACCSTHEAMHWPDFYAFAGEQVLGDIRRYRAAAFVANFHGPCLRRFRPMAEASPGDLCWTMEVRPRVAEFCYALQDWRALLSNRERSYPALNRTLDHLPAGVSPRLVCEALPHLHLARAVTDRVELTVLLLGSECLPHPHLHLFQHATRRQILAALELVNREQGWNLSARNTSHLGRFVQFVKDYPEVHRGNLVGLTRASIRFHRHLATMAPFTVTCGHEDGTMAQPPIPLPNYPGLTFLDTAAAIHQEAARMGHCIASYIELARHGRSFLFHYECDGEMASIEVRRDGRVAQAFGPRNTDNAAARKVRRLLDKWGRGFPEVPEEEASVQLVGQPLYEDIPF
jgi:hypothetical protein